jgi:hypothetical protein
MSMQRCGYRWVAREDLIIIVEIKVGDAAEKQGSDKREI